MRGISNTPRVSTETFLLMDRLYGTLENKIETWEEAQAMNKGCCGSISMKNPAVQELLKERLLVAYDLSAAFNYLHGLKYVSKLAIAVFIFTVRMEKVLTRLFLQIDLSRYQTGKHRL